MRFLFHLFQRVSPMVWCCLSYLMVTEAMACDVVSEGVQTLPFLAEVTCGIEAVVGVLNRILFFEILGFPMLVLWLVIGGIFFTLWLGFVNIRLFRHAVAVVRGKYSSQSDDGEVTHLGALTAAVSGTVGLGNIAGVAIAVSLGGPGAVVWMMIAAFFGMSTKFAEVTLGQKYREIDENGKVTGGAFLYLNKGLAQIKLPKVGKALSVIFAICCIGGSFGGGNMFQANQMMAMLNTTFPSVISLNAYIAFAMAVGVGIVLIGGIKRIAQVTEALVPFMAIIYIVGALVVIAVNVSHLGEAIIVMIKSAFGLQAVGGGVLGAVINGFRRAAFSNEAGLGSSPIAHAAAKTKEPVREGAVALLEPFIDTIIICFMTGLVITVTGVYMDGDAGGIEGSALTARAFATVIDWFPIVLTVAVILFAYSTMITWSYYGERAWSYVFGKRSLRLYHILFCIAVFLGGTVQQISLIVDLSDLMIFSMAIPNLIGLYLLSGVIRREVNTYIGKLKNGEFKVNETRD